MLSVTVIKSTLKVILQTESIYSMPLKHDNAYYLNYIGCI